MLFNVSFTMLDGVTSQQVREGAMGWERECHANPPSFKIIGKFGYYGARSGFYLIRSATVEDFYPMLKWFSDIFLWDVRPVHQLEDYFPSDWGRKEKENKEESE